MSMNESEVNRVFQEGRGETFVVPRLRAVVDKVCGSCNVVNSTTKLMKCAKCELQYYCSRECQVQHWPEHKALCKEKRGQKEFVNSAVYSVPQMMLLGKRLFANEEGFMLGSVDDCGILPASIWRLPRAPISVLRVRVSSADRSGSVEVNALFSAAAQASSMSERLAERLGLSKGAKITVAGLRSFNGEAHLPSSSVDVECLDVFDRTVLPRSSRMALVIMPNPGNEMVLGKDWLDDIVRQSQRHLLLDCAPDKMRIRVSPAGVDVRTLDLQAFHAATSSTRIDAGEFIALPWGYSDPGPGYQANPRAMEMSHLVRPDNSAREELARIAAAAV